MRYFVHIPAICLLFIFCIPSGTEIMAEEIASATDEISSASDAPIEIRDIPSPVIGLLPSAPKLADYIAARNILTASAQINDQTGKEIAEKNANLYEEYKKVMLYIARLQEIAIQLNKQIVEIDRRRSQYEQTCAEELKARSWIDNRIKECEEAKAAGIPDDTTDFVRWLEDQQILIGE